MAAAIAIDVATSVDSVGAAVAAATGVGLLAAALTLRAAGLIPAGLVLLGAGYAVALEARGGAVDGGAVLLAPAFLVTAELAFWSLEPRAIRAGRDVVLPRIGVLGAAISATVSLAIVTVALNLLCRRRTGVDPSVLVFFRSVLSKPKARKVAVADSND